MTRGIVAASVYNISRNFKHIFIYDYKMNAFMIGKANKVRACWYEPIGAPNFHLTSIRTQDRGI